MEEKYMRISYELSKKINGVKFEQLPSDLVIVAKHTILDTIAVTLAGSVTESANVINRYVQVIGGKEECTIIGRNAKNSSVNAVLVNSATGHALDYDDVSRAIIGHPAVVTVFPALAMAEKTGATGKEIIQAVVAGYEAIACIGRGVLPEFLEKGWHSSATIGPFGAAAACGRIIGLDDEAMTIALGIAGTQSAGIKINLGAMTKHFQVGKAASNGVTAALLSQMGYTAPSNILEGKQGFCYVYAPRYDLDVMVKSFGNPYDMMDYGAAFKTWPTCFATHPTIEASVILAEEYDINPKEIKRVEIWATPIVLDHLRFLLPQSAIEAMFSATFGAAVALIKRKVGLKDFTDQVVKEAAIQDLMKKMTLNQDPEFSQKGFMLSRDTPAKTRVEIYMNDGRILKKEIELTKGSKGRKLTAEELVEKYTTCASSILKKSAIDRSLNIILNLEKEKDVSALMEALR
jgi:2-methylcitrate dehydratase PrpD